MSSLREDDIDFSRLTDKTFEECCFDLLARLGFHDLEWRRGGADKGRDIEGRFPVSNLLVGSYPERWFFECKRYSKGVPPAELNSKIAWADADRPDHLVFLLTSYLSTAAREWLEKQCSKKPYRIHTIDGKNLKQLLVKFPDVVRQHLGDEFTQLVRDAKRQWLLHDLLPEPAALNVLSEHLADNLISTSDVAFLWCSYYIRQTEVKEWCEDNEYFCYDSSFPILSKACTPTRTVLSKGETLKRIESTAGYLDPPALYSRYIAGRYWLQDRKGGRLVLYSFVS